MKDPLRQTLLARVYDVAIESPLEKAYKLSRSLGSAVYIKREDLQPVHSFKLRGAYNKLSSLNPSQRKAGVLAASAGNHAQGVALSAQKLGITATIVMPLTTPDIKIEAVKSYGAHVILHGDNYSEAFEYAMVRLKKTNETFVHPFDDPLVITGQGTIGREILEQLPEASHIFVSVGGGGLIAGIAQYVKSLRPDIIIIGVEPKDSNAMQASLRANRRVTLDHVGIFADGVAVKQVGKLTFALTRQYVDEVITVDNDQICAAIQAIFEETRSIVEPAGALGVAGLVEYQKTHDLTAAHCVAICSGANMSFERLQFVAERTRMGSGKEGIFAVRLPEKPGALHRFCSRIINGNNISEFSYRKSNATDATIFVGISFRKPEDRAAFTAAMTRDGYAYDDLSNDEPTKEHIRHMIGGRSSVAKHERLYDINFPERPGALGKFLETMGSDWNISLFHYRGQGADTGRVLIGFEAPDKQTLETTLTRANCEFSPVTSAAVSLFL